MISDCVICSIHGNYDVIEDQLKLFVKKLGIDIKGDALNAAFTRFKELADRKVHVMSSA